MSLFSSRFRSKPKSSYQDHSLDRSSLNHPSASYEAPLHATRSLISRQRQSEGHGRSGSAPTSHVNQEANESWSRTNGRGPRQHDPVPAHCPSPFDSPLPRSHQTQSYSTNYHTTSPSLVSIHAHPDSKPVRLEDTRRPIDILATSFHPLVDLPAKSPIVQGRFCSPPAIHVAYVADEPYRQSMQVSIHEEWRNSRRPSAASSNGSLALPPTPTGPVPKREEWVYRDAGYLSASPNTELQKVKSAQAGNHSLPRKGVVPRSAPMPVALTWREIDAKRYRMEREGGIGPKVNIDASGRSRLPYRPRAS